MTAALIGCSNNKPNVENPPNGSATAEATSVPSSPPSAVASVEATPTPSAQASAAPSAAASAAPVAKEPGPAPKEAVDKMPKDRKFVAGKMPESGSVRTGKGACCAAGSCGECVKDAKASKRTGKAECCGKGTCGPC